MPKEILIMHRNHEDSLADNEIVCVHRYQKKQFMEKGIHARPIATEFQWDGNRIPIPSGGSYELIRKMLKTNF